MPNEKFEKLYRQYRQPFLHNGKISKEGGVPQNLPENYSDIKKRLQDIVASVRTEMDNLEPNLHLCYFIPLYHHIISSSPPGPTSRNDYLNKVLNDSNYSLMEVLSMVNTIKEELEARVTVVLSEYFEVR